MHIGYKRVSTSEQSTARQLADIALDRVYEDFASGATRDRPELKRCLDALREGDTLHVHSVDRLSRSMRDLLDIVEQVLNSGASLIIYSPRLEFKSQQDDYLQRFQLQLFGIVGEMERSMIRQRQRLDRMAIQNEVHAITQSIKDAAAFLGSEQASKGIDAMRQYVEVCERIQALRADGTFETIINAFCSIMESETK